MTDTMSADTSTTHDAVHAEVARLLTTPGGLEESQYYGKLRRPEQRRQLRNFRGFITKVMQNGIRKYIPSTMTALSLLNIELEFYISVSPEYQRQRADGPIPPEQHLAWYEAALNDWVDRSNIEGGVLCCDILAHELVLNYARKSRAAPAFPAEGAVWIDGEVLIRRYTHDVPATLRDLAEGRCAPRCVALGTPVILAHWLDTDGGQTATEIDFLAAAALSLVDGRRSIEDIASEFEAREWPQIDFQRLKGIFANLSQFGGLRLSS